MSIVTRQENWTGGIHAEPGITAPLMAALTPQGRQTLLAELREAVRVADNPEEAMRVIESWWLTLQMRNDPDYQQNMADPGQGRWYTREEFRKAIGL